MSAAEILLVEAQRSEDVPALFAAHVLQGGMPAVSAWRLDGRDLRLLLRGHDEPMYWHTWARVVSTASMDYTEDPPDDVDPRVVYQWRWQLRERPCELWAECGGLQQHRINTRLEDEHDLPGTQ